MSLSTIKISNSFIGLVLIALIAFIVMLFMLEINGDRRTIDEFEQLLKPIKSSLKQDSSVGLLMSEINSERIFELQFVLAPIVLQHNHKNLDTLLIVQKLGGDELVRATIDTIYTSQNENYSIILGINKHSN